jgi:hypothetical protein
MRYPLHGLAVPIIAVLCIAERSSRAAAQLPVATVSAETNDNRVAAGRVENDTLVVRLTIRPADWYILGDSAPAFRVLTFAEEGKPPSPRRWFA